MTRFEKLNKYLLKLGHYTERGEVMKDASDLNYFCYFLSLPLVFGWTIKDDTQTSLKTTKCQFPANLEILDAVQTVALGTWVTSSRSLAGSESPCLRLYVRLNNTTLCSSALSSL